MANPKLITAASALVILAIALSTYYGVTYSASNAYSTWVDNFYIHGIMTDAVTETHLYLNYDKGSIDYDVVTYPLRTGNTYSMECSLSKL